MTPQALDNFEIPSDLAECQRKLTDLVDSLKLAFGKLGEKDEHIVELQRQIQMLVRAKYGRLSEGLTSGQLRLFEEQSPPAPERAAAKEVQSAPAASGGSHGRRRPSKELPRRRVVHELSEKERCCPECGEERQVIGEEVSERYAYQPSVVQVIEDVRLRYGCADCVKPHIEVAAVPAKPIPKGLADGSMIAYIAVSKFADHLPLHRLEGIFRRHGAEIARSTMCEWLAAAADLVLPIYERMKERVLTSRVIWTDDTPVDLQDRTHENNIRQARWWAYLGDRNNELAVFDFTDSRKRDGPVNFLQDFKGFLQADAYAGYDCVYAAKTVREVACWAHARRKFFDALGSNKRSASRALRHIQLLYRIEKRYAQRSAGERATIRQTRSRKVLALLKKWLDLQVAVELKGPLAKAIRYALNNWEALCTYTDDAELTIDNNKAERALRAVAVGRKNWLFAGSHNGGRTAAILCSLIASCKLHGVDPLAYLTDILQKMCSGQLLDLDSLLPDQWTAA